MEAIRQVIDSALLDGVIPLPVNFQNKSVEIIVMLAEEKTVLPSFAMDEIDECLTKHI